MFLFEFILFSSIVTLLTQLAKKFKPELSGILAAFPTTQAFALFFYVNDVDPSFAAKTSLYNLMGIFGASSLIICYMFMAKRGHNIALCSMASVSTFLLLALSFSEVPNSVIMSLLVPIAGILFLVFFLGSFSKTEKKSELKNVTTKNSFLKLSLKAAVSSILVLMIIELGKRSSPGLAGVISALPATLLPSLILIHAEMGKGVLEKFVIGTPLGQIAMVAYGLTNYLLIDDFGIFNAMLFSYIADIGAVLIFKKPISFLITSFRIKLKPSLIATQ